MTIDQANKVPLPTSQGPFMSAQTSELRGDVASLPGSQVLTSAVWRVDATAKRPSGPQTPQPANTLTAKPWVSYLVAFPSSASLGTPLPAAVLRQSRNHA